MTDISYRSTLCLNLIKNVAPLACCNFSVHQQILTIFFGRHARRESAIKRLFIFPLHVTNVSALPGKTRKHENRTFSCTQMLYYYFARVQPVAAWFLHKLCWLATTVVQLSKLCNQPSSALGCCTGPQLRRNEVGSFALQQLVKDVFDSS